MQQRNDRLPSSPILRAALVAALLLPSGCTQLINLPLPGDQAAPTQPGGYDAPAPVGDEALAAAREAAEADKNNADLQWVACRAYFSQDAWYQGLEACARIPEGHPRYFDALRAMTRMALNLHAYNRSANLSRRIASADGRDARAHYFLGWSLRKLDRREDAAAAFRNAVTIFPGLQEAHHAAAVNYFEMGEYPKGIASVDRALRLDPDDQQARETRRIALANIDRRIEPHRKAVIDGKSNVKSYIELATAYREMGYRTEALWAIDTALSMLPHETGTDRNAATDQAAFLHFNRGVLLRELERPSEAVESLEHSIRLRPKHAAGGYYQLGMTHLELQNYAAAAEAFQSSVDLAPGAAASHQGLAQARQGMAEQAQAAAAAAASTLAVAASTPPAPAVPTTDVATPATAELPAAPTTPAEATMPEATMPEAAVPEAAVSEPPAPETPAEPAAATAPEPAAAVQQSVSEAVSATEAAADKAAREATAVMEETGKAAAETAAETATGAAKEAASAVDAAANAASQATGASTVPTAAKDAAEVPAATTGQPESSGNTEKESEGPTAIEAAAALFRQKVRDDAESTPASE